METLIPLANRRCSNGRGFYLNECVIEQEHGRSNIPYPCPAVIEHLTEITHIADLWVPDAEFPVQVSTEIHLLIHHGASVPDDQRGVKHEQRNHDRNDQTGNQAQDRIRVGE